MITFPANFLPEPQLFFIAEHNVGKKFPMLDIYPYLKGRGDLKIKSVSYTHLTLPTSDLV